LIAYAKSKGAAGLNMAGICCTSNETLVREGIPSAGNFLHQELAILTGAVEAMVVDVQCIMQALPALASNFHTEIITTSPKVKIQGATHIPFDEHNAYEVAQAPSCAGPSTTTRTGPAVQIPNVKSDVVPGFSHEYINYMLGGSFRASLRPLNDAIMAGRIRGVVANVGCNNPRVQQDGLHNEVVQATAGQRRAGRRDRLRRAGQRQVRAAGGRGDGPGRPRLREICEADRHPAGAAHGFLRGQHAHPHRAEPDGHRRRPGRRHRRHSGGRVWRRSG
jgi:hypothetical protein